MVIRMHKVDIKEKWFCQLARKARFNISVNKFAGLSQEALNQFHVMGEKGIRDAVICERLESPEVLVRKTIEGRAAVLQKGKAIALWILFFTYCICWYATWPYYAVVFKSLLIAFGIFYVPQFCWRITGGGYYSICASLLKKVSNATGKICIINIGIIIIFILFGIVVFPYALLSRIFSYFFMVLFYSLFIFYALLSMIFGMLNIRRLKMSGLKLLYMGNGMLQSFFLLALWNACSANFSNHLQGFWGILLVPIPFVVEMLIVNLKKF